MKTNLGSIEEEIRDSTPTDMLVLVADVREDDAACDIGAGPSEGDVLQVVLAGSREAEEPKNRVGVLCEDREPDAEDEGVDLRHKKAAFITALQLPQPRRNRYLVKLVEAGENDRVVRQVGEQGLAHLPPLVLLDRPRPRRTSVVRDGDQARVGDKIVLEPSLAMVRDEVGVWEVDDCTENVSV